MTEPNFDTIAKLEDAAAACNLEVYGPYQGRGFFSGWAITVEDMGDLLKLGAAMEREGLGDLANRRPHVDSLGRGYIVAFPDAVLK